MNAIFMLALCVGWRADAAGRDVGSRPAGHFDYYVLALSWVPGFCAIHRKHTAECAQSLGFALHGLWPQFNDGGYPTDCGSSPLTPDEIQRYQGLYADPSLIGHEWPKHGTCSGLTATAYFALVMGDRRRVRIPASYDTGAFLAAADASAVKSAFMVANPRLASAAIKTLTAGGVLTEVEVCLTKSGDFRPC